ncbi:MAG TPA: ferrochelatase, partial [Pirellulales bacterium]|nr:ferrochelatase [Pirellulales bacterium]
MPDIDPYDAVLVVSFGGPERPADVLPFLERVVRGKPVPRERLLEVAEHYYLFGGKSPLNDQNRALIRALQAEFIEHGPKLPIYWGNRNWHPLLPDTLRQMTADGMRRALALVTSAFSSYSSCRQYLENVAAARAEVGPSAPRVDKLRAFYNHPGFVGAMTERVREALERLPAERRAAARLVYTAHSIPMTMAVNCRYEAQLREACRLVSAALDRTQWGLAYQSRSGRPSDPWLTPDLEDRLRELAAAGVRDVVVAPIGFVSDHLEVLYDLDTQAQRLCGELGLQMVRAGTVGTHPLVIAMYRELILERMDSGGGLRVSGGGLRVDPYAQRRALGPLGPEPDICPTDC